MLRFKIRRLLVEISFMFTAVVSVFLLLDKTGISVIALLACFIHELAHMTAFIAVGYTPKKLSFEMSGIRLTKPAQELSRGKELFVLFAGSGANLLIFLLLIKSINQISFFSIFAVTHLLLGIFNLLPIKNFDGGKILFLLLSYFMSEGTSDKICGFVDFLSIIILLIFSVFMVVTTKKNFSLLAVTICLLMSSVIKIIKK